MLATTLLTRATITPATREHVTGHMVGFNNDDVVAAVLTWGGPRLRDLPWRRTRDPWAVLVSEVMSQQTGVERVVGKWTAFMERYPTPADLATAPLGDVLEIWTGLGYPRRARALREAAQRIAEHGWPRDIDGLMELPGVGAYTSRAVAAFAFGRHVGVVDTNVGRTLARWCGRPLRSAEAQQLADSLVPEGEEWLWNQVMMDFGASVCTARTPHCETCPVRDQCGWAGSGDDPAARSAAVSRPQSRFAGSDREARGRLLRAVLAADVAVSDVPELIDRTHAVAERVTASLLADGLITRAGARLHAPR